MTIRVRDKARPGDDSRDIDLGPNGHGERLPLKAMRMPLDEAIVYAARRGHEIRGVR